MPPAVLAPALLYLTLTALAACIMRIILAMDYAAYCDHLYDR